MICRHLQKRSDSLLKATEFSYTVVSRLCEARLGEIFVFVKRDFGPAYNIAMHFVLDYVKFRLCETKNGLLSCSHKRETTVTLFFLSTNLSVSIVHDVRDLCQFNSLSPRDSDMLQVRIVDGQRNFTTGMISKTRTATATITKRAETTNRRS